MNIENKNNICVLFGGRSVEHEISVITGIQYIEAVDREKYNPIPVYVAQCGKWYTGKELLDKNFYRGLPNCLDKLTEVTLLPKPGVGGLTVVSKKSLFASIFGSSSDIIPVDVFVPSFHGTYGEDGCIQGLFEMADVAYAGSNVLASAVAMNKAICKAVANQNEVPTLPFVLAYKYEASQSLQNLREKILKTKGLEKFPLFVKPCHLGSSIGISRARDEVELDSALAGVFKYDEVAIIEPCVTDIMEVNVSVLDGDTRIASVTEIPVGTGGVLSYEDKYMKEGAGKKGKAQSNSEGMASLIRVIDPKELAEDTKNKITTYALKLSEALGSSGVGRFDFIIDTGKNEIYFNELNPIPGCFSFYLWEKSKPPIIYTQLINRMIKRALDRKASLSGYEKNTGFKAMFG
jgi:D-alanine-D-alanine ligase